MAAPQPAGSAYLTLSRIVGHPGSLLDGYLRASDVMTEVGRDHGLILHAAAQTEEGLLIVNLWTSSEGSESAARDPRRLAVLREGGVGAAQIHPEHHDVVNHVVFGAGWAVSGDTEP